MVIERKTVFVGKLFVLFKLVASTRAFAWKIRSSPATGEVPPQFAGLFQLLLEPPPFQKRLAAELDSGGKYNPQKRNRSNLEPRKEQPAKGRHAFFMIVGIYRR